MMYLSAVTLLFWPILMPISAFWVHNPLSHWKSIAGRSIIASTTIDSPTSVISDQYILDIVSKSDRGTSVSKKDRLIFQQWFNETADRFIAQSTKSPLDDDLAFGNFDVSYVDAGKSESANPAGGRLFRGFIGRILYRNEGLFQHLIREPNADGTNKIIAINYIKGKLFNLFHLAIILRGVITRVSDEERLRYMNKYNSRLSANGTVRAEFEPPIIAFGRPDVNPFSLRVGPGSFVILDTPYLSPTIRLGRGSRGSLFLFTRTSDLLADTWKPYLAVTPKIASQLGKKVLASGVVGYFASEYLLQNAHPLVTMLRKVFKFCSALTFAVGFFLSVSRGGIERDEFAFDVKAPDRS